MLPILLRWFYLIDNELLVFDLLSFYSITFLLRNFTAECFEQVVFFLILRFASNPWAFTTSFVGINANAFVELKRVGESLFVFCAFTDYY